MSSRNEPAVGRKRQAQSRVRPDEAAAERQSAPHAGGRPRDPAIEEAILRATRKRLASDGYSRMTIGDVVADAGVTRPTLYRRWPGKYELTVDALLYGLREQRAAYQPMALDAMTPLEAFTEAVRRVDPRYSNPHAMSLHGNFMAEAEREPDLFTLIRDHATKPRCDELLDTLRHLQSIGAVRQDVDLDAAVTLCLGSYFGDYLLTGQDTPRDLADRTAGLLWPTLRADDSEQSSSDV
ncbi:TetR family transcriptional regulator [Streptomyces spiroverticillatus]|uniref:TetR family transcriptional regulator n=1 Tax=Streptomyces finlayi TaxID=67296 RepID=A0A918X5F7_9ACTN|nr:TetR/AcrR family transcriptional regulator [Streptomyces finlayi]GHA49298.1 TetR family transcriptional regulator [Streptomyces spiroverticillatus]GHD13634.1 TetR family transcriptional regulator [Streptomyces finlayi]